MISSKLLTKRTLEKKNMSGRQSLALPETTWEQQIPMSCRPMTTRDRLTGVWTVEPATYVNEVQIMIS